MASQNDFDVIARERITNSGRACVEKAREMWASGGDEGSAEARHWIKLALEADKDDLARRVKHLEGLLAKKRGGREAADDLKKQKRAANGGNVVPLRDEV